MIRGAGPAASRPRAGAAEAAEVVTRSYRDLVGQVRDDRLLERRLTYYWASFGLAVLAGCALAVLVAVLGDSWWQVVPAAVLGVLLTQFGFLGHDAAHRQIFRSAAWNDWSARVLSGLFAGLSYGWWRGKHNRHHAAPNQEGRDPDVAPGVLVVTRDDAERRSTGPAGWFQRHQGWLLLPLLTLEGLNLHVASVRSLTRRTAGATPPVRHRALELSMILGRFAAYLVALLWVMPPAKAAAFLAVQLAVFGLCLGGSFVPNHVGMPIAPRGARIDFLRRQVLMSRNIRGGPVLDVLMGGLNHQIEHHLFPSMPRPNLRRARPIVRAYCGEHEVPYTEVGLLACYALVVRHLNEVGLRARGPFDCPLAADLRAGGG